MQIGVIRNLIREYDNQWSWRKLFRGDHDVVRSIKEFLADYAGWRDGDTLQPTDLYKLYQVTNDTDELMFVHDLRCQLGYTLCKIMDVLDPLKIASESNFIRLRAIDSERARTLLEVFTPAIESLFAAQSINMRQKLVDMMLSLCDPQIFFTAKNITTILRELAAADLLNENNVNLVVSSGRSVYSVAGLLAIFAQADQAILNQAILRTICKAEISYLSERGCQALLQSGCLTRANVERLLPLDLSCMMTLDNLLKLVIDKKVSFSQKVWDKIFAGYIKFVWLLSSLQELNILTTETVSAAADVETDIEINAIYHLVYIATKKQQSLSIQNFVLLCKYPQRNKLIKLLEAFEGDDFVIDRNLTALLALADVQLDYINDFIFNQEKIIRRDQDALDKLIVAVTKSGVIQQRQPIRGNALEYIENNLYAIAQDGLAMFYLQPFPVNGKPVFKLNLKNGHVERLIHGGMHAGRTFFCVKILHAKFIEYFPSYSKAAIKRIAEFFKLTEKQLLACIRLAMLCHDSAREDEKEDRWDDKSGLNCRNFLLGLGVPAALAEFLGNSAALKDKPQVFANYLDSLGIDKQAQLYFHYARKLIYLGDCYDIIRCIGKFDLSYVFKCFRDIPEYQKDKHEEPLIELAVQIHHLVYTQGDMRFICNITHPDGRIIQTCDQGGNFKIEQKAGFEHAENTLAALAASMRENPYFAAYLQDEPVLDTSPAQTQSLYNPNIHGTSSVLFANLERTNQQLMPTKLMLADFGLAPLSGEIDTRGLSGPYTGEQISFGLFRVNGKDGTQYDLMKVISSYSTLHLRNAPNKEQLISDIKKEIHYGLEKGFNNLTVITVCLARAKQFGVTAEELESALGMSAFMRDLRATQQVYYLYLLLDRYIHPALVKFKKCPSRLDVSDAIYTHLTFDNVRQKIAAANLDLQDVYDNPTPEKLANVIKILELPNKLEVAPRESYNKKRHVTLTETLFFTSEQKDVGYVTAEDGKCDSDREISLGRKYAGDLLYGSSKADTLNKYLQGLVSGVRYTSLFMQNMALIITNYIVEFNDKIKLLQDILSKTYPALTDSQLFFINNRFPVVLVVEDHKDVKVHHLDSAEYRTRECLQFGTDIKTIATDSEEHRLILMKYLEKHRVQHVQVVLFVDLYLSHQSGLRPQSPYTHADGFPRLTWLAAKACKMASAKVCWLEQTNIRN